MRYFFKLARIVSVISFYAVVFLIKPKMELIGRAADRVLKISGVDVECEGHLPGKPLIIMANHESFFDIPVLIRCFGYNIIWFARESLFKIPVFGRSLRKSGAIPVARNDPRRASFAILRALKKRAEGVMVIFPQGTRRHYRRFEKGGVIIAKKKGIPIVPVKIDGTRSVMAPNSWKINSGKVRVKVFDPIRVDDYNESEIELMVRERIYA